MTIGKYYDHMDELAARRGQASRDPAPPNALLPTEEGKIDDLTRSRFWSKVEKGLPHECWPWKGAPDPHGYGCMSVRNRRTRATHLSLTMKGENRPTDKHFACHTCDNPICVNPAHLWWGTQQENMRDASVKGHMAKIQKSHCHRGHPFSGENLRMWNGNKVCRACSRIKGAKHDAKRRGKVQL